VLGSSDDLTTAFVAGLDDSQKGFHTAEFLIYGEDSHKKASAMTARELEYLAATAQNLKNVADALAASWLVGVDGKPAYRGIFVTAGEADNTTYPSLSAVGEEIVNGWTGICDEVADGKIATPFDEQDPNKVESQFSYNSLQDFSDNLRSVQNAYLGAALGKTATAGASISERIAAQNQDLDNRVKSEIEAAITAVLAIPAPFPVSLKVPANAATIHAAQDAIRTLRATLNDDVMPIVKG
jgi:predicted lipoprotein